MWPSQGRIQDFKLGGAHLKKLRRAEAGANIFGVFRVKNDDFMPKNIFPNFKGRRMPGVPPWIRPCFKGNMKYGHIRQVVTKYSCI